MWTDEGDEAEYLDFSGKGPLRRQRLLFLLVDGRCLARSKRVASPVEPTRHRPLPIFATGQDLRPCTSKGLNLSRRPRPNRVCPRRLCLDVAAAVAGGREPVVGGEPAWNPDPPYVLTSMLGAGEGSIILGLHASVTPLFRRIDSASRAYDWLTSRRPKGKAPRLSCPSLAGTPRATHVALPSRLGKPRDESHRVSAR